MQFKKLFILTGIIFILTVLYFAFEYFFIPEKIYMTTGESYVMNMSSPFEGEIKANEVISINNKKVSENINIDLDGSNTIVGHDSTVADMDLKFMGLSIKNVKLCFMPEKKVEVIGKPVGICVDTKGVLVLGTGKVNCTDGKSYMPCRDSIMSGDIITKINGVATENKEELEKLVNTGGNLHINILRNGKDMEFDIKPVICEEDKKYKLGLWVRDSTQGIGTITYYDRESNTFGALGHPINDVDTGKLMEIEGGEILEADVGKTMKGRAGAPGSLVGDIHFDETIGYIKSNNKNGIFGSLSEELNGVEMPIGYKNNVKTGNGSIYMNLMGDSVEKFSIHIDSINRYNTSDTKNFVFTVTDKRLLSQTGGIVQGMSGCPIVQDGKLIGAVTHVFVNDPTKGYGIFIENMMNMQ